MEMNKKNIGVLGVVLVIMLFLLTSCSNNSLVGSWSGSGSIYVTKNGAVTGSIVGSYSNYYVSSTSFDDHSIRIEYYDVHDNRLTRSLDYEYSLEDGGNTLVILSQTMTDYYSDGSVAGSETKNYANMVYKRE